MVDNKLIVNGGIALAIGYLFLNMSSLEDAWPWWVPAAALGIAGYFFNTHFIDKVLLAKRDPVDIGPPEPFNPSVRQPQFELNPETGEPMRTTRVPKSFRGK